VFAFFYSSRAVTARATYRGMAVLQSGARSAVITLFTLHKIQSMKILMLPVRQPRMSPLSKLHFIHKQDTLLFITSDYASVKINARYTSKDIWSRSYGEMSFLAATIPLHVLPCISIHSSNHSGQRDAGSDTLRQLHGLRTDSLTLVIPMCI
jgi:hypothetical protein